MFNRLWYLITSRVSLKLLAWIAISWSTPPCLLFRIIPGLKNRKNENFDNIWRLLSPQKSTAMAYVLESSQPSLLYLPPFYIFEKKTKKTLCTMNLCLIQKKSFTVRIN